jgi:hypothetical protein
MLATALAAFSISLGIFPHETRAIAFLSSPSQLSPQLSLQAHEESQMRSLKSIGQKSLGVVSSLAIAAGVSAQDAVQWRVEDGGNGHWYLALNAVTGDSGLALAASLGGHLATILSEGENTFVKQVFLATDKQWGWLGLRQLNGQSSPSAGWYWLTEESLNYSNWTSHDGAFPTGAPDDSPCALPPWGVENDQANQGAMDRTGRWDDLETGAPSCGGPIFNTVALIEWSADCNSDGIVDYGQIRAGELEDANGNNIPDCCEQSTSCEPCAADIDGSGTVNAVDLAAILTVWGTDGGKYPRADINGDGEVNGPDLAAVLSSWGACP